MDDGAASLLIILAKWVGFPWWIMGKTLAEFSTLESAASVLCSCAAVKQNSLT
jgi:hypothetical protein